MLRLDPAAAPLWRSTDSLQFGVDPVLARLDGVAPGADHVVAALAAGTDRVALAELADRVGLHPLDLAALLDDLAPVIAEPSPSPPALSVRVTGAPDLARRLARHLLLEPDAGGPDLVILAAHHLVPPAETVRWLALDVPHLAVVHGDQAVTLGPLVLPGTTPCLRCADEHRLDDPAWAAVAAQLLRRRTSRTAGPVALGLRVAALLADVLRARREGAPTGLEGAALRVAPDGSVSRVPRPWHGRCWCRTAGPAAPGPTGTGTAPASPDAAPPTGPTTAAGGRAPA